MIDALVNLPPHLLRRLEGALDTELFPWIVRIEPRLSSMKPESGLLASSVRVEPSLSLGR